MINTCTFTGRFARDPEISRTEDGKAVAKFQLGLDVYSKGVKNPIFPSFVAFGSQAEVVEKFCKKGNLIGVTSRLTIRSYDNKEGKKVLVYEFICENIILLGAKNEESANG